MSFVSLFILFSVDESNGRPSSIIKSFLLKQSPYHTIFL